MSWLAQGLTQSVTGRISQLSGQLKDILNEGTEDVLDPNAELKALNEKLKENEKHIEMLKMECTRWQEECNELNVKCQTYEAQLEQRQNDYRQNIIQKDALIADLRRQLSASDLTSSDSMSRSGSNLSSLDKHQKSALMEEFEELMPQSEFSDYLHLQKEIKRLSEDNSHLANENKQLLSRLKYFENKSDDLYLPNENSSINEQALKQQLENTIDSLKQEIFSLKKRLEHEKDKHQEEIIAVQNSYKSRISSQLNENQAEIESLREQLSVLQSKLDEKTKELDLKVVDTISSKASSSNKSDDGWCLNGDDLNLNLEEKTESKKVESVAGNDEREQEIVQLRHQIEMFETELEQANGLILRLKSVAKESSSSPSPKKPDTTSTWSQTDADVEPEFNLQHQEELNELMQKIAELEAEKASTGDSFAKCRLEAEQARQANEQLDNELDSLKLEHKQLQQNVNQEKLLQMQEQKQERQELAKLRTENTELKIKLDEKLSEIKLLGDQINDLNANVNGLKSADSTLFAELQQKTQRFVVEMDSANQKIADLIAENEAHKLRLENSNEQRKQFEFVLDEKTRECSQLKTDVQKHLQHIAAQSKALEKLQSECKKPDTKAEESQTVDMEAAGSTEKKDDDELVFLKQQYNQIYSYLEQKNHESLNYYNEIQRLNLLLSEMSRELQNAKGMNESLHEQYDTLLKEFQLEQRMVEDLNQQTSELTNTLLSTTNVATAAVVQMQLDDQRRAAEEKKADEDKQKKLDTESAELVEKAIKREVEEDLLKQEQQRVGEIEERNRQIVEQMQFQIDQMEAQLGHLAAEKETLRVQSERELNELSRRLNETVNYYENELKNRQDSVQQSKMADEQQVLRVNKELERLREHLVEMSDSYNKEAIQAEEREKSLRTALNDAQRMLEQQGNSLEMSSKEIEVKLEQVTQSNHELRGERDKLKERLKQTEETLNHQVKVTKNLELVLERIQNEKDGQHSIEVSKYQQTIKDHAALIHSLQRDALTYQRQIDDLKKSLEDAMLLEIELSNKEHQMKQLQAQVATKDALIDSLDKRVNEIQKVNDAFIEKDIIKSLIIGYIKISQAQERKQVLKLISTMLNFTQAEMEQVESANESKWFGLLKASPNPKGGKSSVSQAESALNKSFTELFIQYVDRESKPKPNLAFDINNPNISQTNKKTDSPGSAAASSSLLSNNPASAVKFFNNSLIVPNGGGANDLTLVNRSQSSSASDPSSSLMSSTIASPAVANSFLEQILK